MTGATDHLKRSCPQKEEMERVVAVARKDGDMGADEDAYHEKLRTEDKVRKGRPGREGQPLKKKPKVVNFK
jgi:hypothetical protein